jgi:hypothetical protein
VSVRGFAGKLVRFHRVIMGQDRVMVCLGGVLMRFLVVTLAMVLGSEVVMLGCFFVMMRRLVVCFV